jgi:hypothetical protein
MGRRKRSDINRAENFSKGDSDRDDQPTKRPRIGLEPFEGTRKRRPGKENQPVQLSNGRTVNTGSHYWQAAASPEKLVTTVVFQLIRHLPNFF